MYVIIPVIVLGFILYYAIRWVSHTIGHALH